MGQAYDVKIRLIGNRSPCHSGHKVGDEWLWQDKAPAGLCFAAYNSLYPFALVLRYGGRFPWQEDPDAVTMSCPDADVVNRFELRRVPPMPEQVESYDIRVKLMGKGTGNPCSAGHMVGDEWLLGEKTPVEMCPSAYNSMFNAVMVLRYGGQFPWQYDPDFVTVSCPDPKVVNRFEIRRVTR